MSEAAASPPAGPDYPVPPPDDDGDDEDSRLRRGPRGDDEGDLSGPDDQG